MEVNPVVANFCQGLESVKPGSAKGWTDRSKQRVIICKQNNVGFKPTWSTPANCEQLRSSWEEVLRALDRNDITVDDLNQNLKVLGFSVKKNPGVGKKESVAYDTHSDSEDEEQNPPLVVAKKEMVVAKKEEEKEDPGLEQVANEMWANLKDQFERLGQYVGEKQIVLQALIAQQHGEITQQKALIGMLQEKNTKQEDKLEKTKAELNDTQAELNDTKAKLNETQAKLETELGKRKRGEQERYIAAIEID